MENQLRLIIELQGIDGQIRELKAEMDREPDRVKELQEEHEAKQNLQDEIVGELKAVKAERKDLELSLDSMKSRLEESRDRQTKAKTEKESRALQKEIGDTETMIKEREDRIYELLDGIESREKKLAETKEEGEKIEEELDGEKSRTAKERKHYDKLFKQLQKEREALAAKLDPELRARYDFLLNHRDGVAVATVKEGVCMQCYMNIPPQMFIMLQRSMKVETCPNCGRLIYWMGHEMRGFNSNSE